MPTIWWLDALRRREKIIRENAFKQNKKKPGLKFNAGLALIGLQTTGPRTPLNIITIINQFKRWGTSRVGNCQKTLLIENLWKKDFVKKFVSSLTRVQTFLSRWKCARKGRPLRLLSVPFPWSLAVHHQSLAVTLRKTKRLRRRLVSSSFRQWTC